MQEQIIISIKEQPLGLIGLSNEIIKILLTEGYTRDDEVIKKLYTLKTSLVGIGSQVNGKVV